MIILVDVDGVCADLVTAVLEKYNKEYKDSLVRENITEYSIAKFAAPYCGKDFEEYFSDFSLYKKVKPIFGALDGILRIRKGGDKVVYITSGFHPAKVEWLHQNGFLSDIRKNWRYSDEVIVCNDKSLIRGDFMVDDKPSNLLGHVGVLFSQPWNKSEITPNRVYDWAGVLKRFNEFKEAAK